MITLAESALKDALRLLIPGEWTPIEDIAGLTSVDVREMRPAIYQAVREGALEADQLYQHFRVPEEEETVDLTGKQQQVAAAVSARKAEPEAPRERPVRKKQDPKGLAEKMLTALTDEWQTAKEIATSLGYADARVLSTPIAILRRDGRVDVWASAGRTPTRYRQVQEDADAQEQEPFVPVETKRIVEEVGEKISKQPEDVVVSARPPRPAMAPGRVVQQRILGCGEGGCVSWQREAVVVFGVELSLDEATLLVISVYEAVQQAWPNGKAS